jgi:hypothetical protein
MHLVNLTAHVVRIVSGRQDDPYIVIPPSGVELRVQYVPLGREFIHVEGESSTEAIEIITDGGVCGVTNLPQRKPHTLFIASYAATAYCNTVLGREDVVCPGTALKDRPIKMGDEVYAVRRLRRVESVK